MYAEYRIKEVDGGSPKKLWCDTNHVEWRSRRRFGSLHFLYLISTLLQWYKWTLCCNKLLSFRCSHEVQMRRAMYCIWCEEKVSGALVGHKSPLDILTPPYFLIFASFKWRPVSSCTKSRNRNKEAEKPHTRVTTQHVCAARFSSLTR